MKKSVKFVFCVLFLTCTFFLAAGERTIPVDVFLMIDKSLSMEDPGKFDSLQKWVLNELIGQMLIPGDWVTVYQFYEKPEHLLTTTVENTATLNTIYNTVKAIKPDGQFTDIGYALETVQAALDARGSNGRFKVLLLLSDLVQDAPWTSKYRGKQESFQSPYLVEARTVKHDNWYEITLDMDIQDAVVQRTQSLYSDVIANEGVPRTESDQDKALIQGTTTVVTNSAGGTSTEAHTAVNTVDTEIATSNNTETGNAHVGGSNDPTSTAYTETANNNAGAEKTPNASGNTTGTAENTGNGSMADNSARAAVSAADNDANNGNTIAANTNGSADTVHNTEIAENIVTDSAIETGDTNGSADTVTDMTDNTADKANTDNGFAGVGAKSKTAQKSNFSFWKEHGTTLLIFGGVLLIIVVLIVIVAHAVREKNRKKEAQKEKINLV